MSAQAKPQSPFPLLLHLDSGKSQEPGRPRQTSPHSPLPPPDSLWLCSIISSKARITSNVNFKPRWSPLLSWSQLYQPQEMWDLREIWVNSHCLDKLIRGAQQIKAEMDMYSRETKSCWGKRGGKLRLTLLFLKEKKKTSNSLLMRVFTTSFWTPTRAPKDVPVEVTGSWRWLTRKQGVIELSRPLALPPSVGQPKGYQIW